MKGPARLTKLSGAALFSNRVRVMHSLHKGANAFAQLLNQRHVPINLPHHCLSSCRECGATCLEDALTTGTFYLLPGASTNSIWTKRLGSAHFVQASSVFQRGLQFSTVEDALLLKNNDDLTRKVLLKCPQFARCTDSSNSSGRLTTTSWEAMEDAVNPRHVD